MTEKRQLSVADFTYMSFYIRTRKQRVLLQPTSTTVNGCSTLFADLLARALETNAAGNFKQALLKYR